MNSSTDNFHRLFIALPVLPPTSGDIMEVMDANLDLRWREEHNLHLTLRFIGEVDAPLRDAVEKSLAPIVVEPFILEVRELGVFCIHGHPDVIYAGIGTGHPRLFQLQRRIEQALFSVGLPYEMRAYNPHITVARVSKASKPLVEDFLKRHRDFSAAPFKVDRFCLYRTLHTHYGHQFEVLRDYPLKIKQFKAV